MTAEEWLAENLPPPEKLPVAKLYFEGGLVASGHVFIDAVNHRGLFYPSDEAILAPLYPEAILKQDGRPEIRILKAAKCSTPLSNHLHFALE